MTDQLHLKWGWIAWAIIAAVAGFVCGVARPAHGAEVQQDQPSLSVATTQPSAIEPEADQILRAAGKYLADAKSFTFNADVWEDVVLAEGQKIKRQKTTKAGVRRPNGIYTETHNERIGRGAWYDGKTLTIYNRQANFYGVVDAPADIDKMVDLAQDRFGIPMPLSDLMISDMYGAVIKNAQRGMYLGRQTVNKVRCHHLAFVQDDVDWEIWIEDGRAPVVRKYLITYKQEDQAPQFEATLSDWNFDAKLDDYAFTFRPPLGASRIDVLTAAKGTDGDRGAGGEATVVKDAQPADKPADRKD